MKLVLLAAALVGSVLCFSGLLPFRSGPSTAPANVQLLYFPNGQEQVRAVLVDGVREGPASEWYASGQVRCSGQYVRGLREGAWVFYAADGTLDPERSGTYSAGVRTGP